MNVEWILCADQLPSNDTWCLVTLENGMVTEMRYTDKWGWGDAPKNRVVAWTELPEPYKKEV